MRKSELQERLRRRWLDRVPHIAGTVHERDPLRMIDGRGGATPAAFGDVGAPADAAVLLRPGPQAHNAGLTAAGREAWQDAEPVVLTVGKLKAIVGEAERVAREQEVHAKRLESHGGRLDTIEENVSEVADAVAGVERKAVAW